MPIPADTLPFLKDIAANNNREWYTANKERYADLQAELLVMTDDLIGQLAQRDPQFGGVEAAKCLFRIHKDARFAKGVPYKTHIGIHIVASGHRADFNRAGFYLHIEPNASFVAGGAHAPGAEWLKVIRQHLINDGSSFEAILNDKTFKKWYGELEGESLKRPPNGFNIETPYMEWVKRKAFTVSHPLSDDELMDKKFLSTYTKAFEVYQPFMNFLNDRDDE